MPNPKRQRLNRCLGKAVNHLEQAIPAIAEVWNACAERDKLIAARPPQEYVPILDDGKEPEPDYTAQLALCLELMDGANTLIIAISENMMGMTHDALLNQAQFNPKVNNVE